MPAAIDELMRYDSPVQLTSRIATCESELRGARIRTGQQVLLLLGSTNRDPRAFERPDELDVTRDASAHLSFSHGLHRCLGAQLARLEGELAVGALLSRFPDLALADAPERAVSWGTNTILRGPKQLNLVY
jgi:cytochrome P450